MENYFKDHFSLGLIILPVSFYILNSTFYIYS